MTSSRSITGSEAAKLTDDVLIDYFTVIQGIINNSSEGETIKIGYVDTDIIPISQVINLLSNRNYIIEGTIKIQDGVFDYITQDIAIGDHTVHVTDSSKFSVGQAVCMTDDGIRVYREMSVGWGGFITEINGNVLTIEGTCNEAVHVAENGRCCHAQGCIIIQDKSNINVTGSGWLDGNRYGQPPVFPSTGLDLHNFWEHNRIAVSLAIWHSENIVWSVNCKDGLVHTAAICSPNLNPAVPTRNKNITVKNCNINTGHDKCILSRFTENSLFENITCDGYDADHTVGWGTGHIVTWEDGLIFYSDGYNITVTNCTFKNLGRDGFCWNSDNGDGLIADGITTMNCGTRNGVGVNITCRNAVLSNLVVRDSIKVGGSYTTYNVVFNNVDLQCNSNAIYLPFDGMVIIHTQDVVFNNLRISNSVSRYEKPAIRITSDGGDITFNGGGIYNHSGYQVLQSGYDRAVWNGFENLVITPG